MLARYLLCVGPTWGWKKNHEKKSHAYQLYILWWTRLKRRFTLKLSSLSKETTDECGFLTWQFFFIQCICNVLFSELRMPMYLIGTKLVHGKHAWITNEKHLELWIWSNGIGWFSGWSSRMIPPSYKVRYGFTNDYRGAGVICEWPKWGNMVWTFFILKIFIVLQTRQPLVGWSGI